MYAPTFLVFLLAVGFPALGAAADAPPPAAAIEPTCSPPHVRGADREEPPSDPTDLTCPGIRPGSLIQMPSGSFCTLNFVFADETKTYVGTAGHCIDVGERARLPSAGQEIGTAVFSSPFSFGRDFALIEVDPEDLEMVDPEICFWGGPTAAYQGGSVQGRMVRSVGHGWASTFGNAPPRPGVGIGQWNDERHFEYTGNLRRGDSGSPVRFDTGEALGIVNSASPPQFPRTIGGTLVTAALAMADEAGFTGLHVVLAGDDEP